MSESVPSSSAGTSAKRGTKIPVRSPKSKFGAVARALWPRKTAAELAYRVGVTERAAKFWLAGGRSPSADAVRAVIDEMLS